MGDPTFWDDPEKAQKTAQDVNSLKEEVDGFHKLSAGVDDLEALQEMAAEENDESLLPEMDELLAKCRSELEHLELGMLLSGEYDANNAIDTACRCRRHRSAGLDQHAAAYVYPLCGAKRFCVGNARLSAG